MNYYYLNERRNMWETYEAAACYRCLGNKYIMHDITLRNLSDFVS